jgi:pyruvate/2-oxoacid:ferredoxin oxidoreductase alpha subunit/pyruvate/2-oxoacid:ferredoxin oxidoreductase beta subunit
MSHQKTQLLNGESASIKAAQALSEHIYTYKNIASPSNENNIWGKSTGQTVYTQQDITARLHHGVHASALVSSDALISAIPQLYKLASEKTGVVLHVSAENNQSASSFADFSKVMAVRQSGLALLSSSTVQEAHDLAVIAHVVAIKTNTPVLHFFDSKRIADEYASIQLVESATVSQLVSAEDLEAFQQHKQHQPPSAYIQYKQQQEDKEVDGKDVDVYAAVQEAMVQFATLTGRHYAPLEYSGHPEAEQVVIAMGAGATVVEKTVDAIRVKDKDAKVGVLKVRLYRPWSDTDLLSTLPSASIKRVAVLEPSHDFTSTWNPLFLDVAAAYQTAEDNDVEIVSGQYGVEAQDFSPAQVQAVFTELAKANFQRKFEVASLDASKSELAVVAAGTEQFVIVGDEALALNYAQGAVSAGKNAQVYTVGGASHVRVSTIPGALLPSFVNEAQAVILQRTDVDAVIAIEGLSKNGVVAVHGAAVTENLTEATKRAIGVSHAKVVSLTNVKDLVTVGLAGVLAKSEALVTPQGWDQLTGSASIAPPVAASTTTSLPVETPYLKMLDQVFQDRLEIANAVNSASVWSRDEQNPSASAPEFGYGKIVNKIQQRARFIDAVEVLIKQNKVSEEVYKTLSQWLVAVKSSKSNIKAINKAADAVVSAIAGVSGADYVSQNKDLLYTKSSWLIGSDSWAYDLGQSGVHHVIAQGENVNMLIVDTLPYSSEVAREQRKKDIGLYAMNFGTAYVASVAVYSSYTGVLHALMEADAYNGPSIILAYLPQEPESTGTVNPVFTLKETKVSVDNGAWPLYRWNPALDAEGKEAFSLDSQRIKKDLEKFLERENHFSQIVAQHPDISQLLVSSLENVSTFYY